MYFNFTFCFTIVVAEGAMYDTLGKIVSPRVSLIVYKIDNSKDRSYRKVQRGSVSHRRTYLVTEPVIGQNHRRIYSKHDIAPKR